MNASDLAPSGLKGSVSQSGERVNLKPSWVNLTYSGGAPQSSELKPSLLTSDGSLKPSLVVGGNIKPSLRG